MDSVCIAHVLFVWLIEIEWENATQSGSRPLYDGLVELRFGQKPKKKEKGKEAAL